MSALDAYDLVTTVLDDPRDLEDRGESALTRAVNRMDVDAGPGKHFRKGCIWPADEADLYALPDKAWQEVTKKFLAASSPSEIVNEENLHESLKCE